LTKKLPFNYVRILIDTSFSDRVNSVIHVTVDDEVFRLGLWMNLSLDRYFLWIQWIYVLWCK